MNYVHHEAIRITTPCSWIENGITEAKYRSKSQSQSKHVIEKQTFIPETRIIRTFCDHSRSKSDISVGDWIDDIEIAFLARKYSDTQKVDIMYSHLEGQAKALKTRSIYFLEIYYNNIYLYISNLLEDFKNGALSESTYIGLAFE